MVNDVKKLRNVKAISRIFNSNLFILSTMYKVPFFLLAISDSKKAIPQLAAGERLIILLL